MINIHAMTESTDNNGRPLAIGCWDVPRAHFYGEAKRRVFTTLSEGADRLGHMALLLRTMYGTQDAANDWGETWREAVRGHGYQPGVANPSLIRGEFVKGFCHRDDLFVAAAEEELDKFGRGLGSRFDVRQTGRVGFEPRLKNDLRILNRVLRVDPEQDCIDLVPDLKHVQVLTNEFGLETSKGVDTPRVRKAPAQNARGEESELLDREGQRRFRSAVMRCLYFGQDRPDISEAVKSLSRYMWRRRRRTSRS